MEASASANVRLERAEARLTGDGQHGRGDVDAQNMPGGADGIGKGEGGVAAAAADIEDAFTKAGAGS